MKRIGLTMPLLICLTITNHAQARTPQILNSAVHCLVTKHNFLYSSTTTVSFGYIIDDKSYPGNKVLYIVNYVATDRLKGFIYVIFITQLDEHQIFDIQNNASFVLTNNDISGVDFTNPPLGGIWTQEHIARAIKRIEKQPRFTISAKNLLSAYPLAICKSYSDQRG